MEDNQLLRDPSPPQSHTVLNMRKSGYQCALADFQQTHKGASKGTRKQGGSGSMYSDICLVPETDGEPIRPLVPLPLFTFHAAFPAPPLNLHPGTHGSWHLDRVQTVWHIKKIRIHAAQSFFFFFF